MNGGHYSPHFDYVMKDKDPDYVSFLHFTNSFICQYSKAFLFVRCLIVYGAGGWFSDFSLKGSLFLKG